jgi:hypothetical protein
VTALSSSPDNSVPGKRRPGTEERKIALIKTDGFVKSQKSRHSFKSRSPEIFELTGFPLSLE